jgi:hypothetical protein
MKAKPSPSQQPSAENLRVTKDEKVTGQLIYNSAVASISREGIMEVMTKIAYWVALASLLVFAPGVNGEDDEQVALENPALKRLYSELRMVVRKYYPKATSHLLKDKIHFEHDTRIFIVHEPTKSGEWQDPWETRGPKPGGILCDMSFQKGPYQGAAVVPQTFDKRYFKVLLLAPYSARRDAHLLIHLSYPGNTSGEFLKEFTRLVNDFEKQVD